VHGDIELWVKILHTLFLALVLPVYFVYYGPATHLVLEAIFGRH